jgi:hypothetical protein
MCDQLRLRWGGLQTSPSLGRQRGDSISPRKSPLGLSLLTGRALGKKLAIGSNPLPGIYRRWRWIRYS